MLIDVSGPFQEPRFAGILRETERKTASDRHPSLAELTRLAAKKKTAAHLKEALGEVALQGAASQSVSSALQQIQQVGVAARHAAVLLSACMQSRLLGS